MYPYVEQLLRWKADDEGQKVGGLVLEVKGDFCGQVRSILARANRPDDYIEIGLDAGVCYNPLHNQLDPYAVAYAVATLLNNLFGRSKEPFWQQAYTDLLKFVILLRRICDGYTTFSEVYRYILDDSEMDHDIRRLKTDPRESARRHCHHQRRVSGALRPQALVPLVPGRPRPHGSPVRGGSGDVPGWSRRGLRGTQAEGRRLGGAQAST